MEGTDSLQAEKRSLRAELRARRTALAPLAGSEAALRAGDAAASLGVRYLRGARRVALYRAYGQEFDPAPIGDAAVRMGATLGYPRVASRRPPRLTFHQSPPGAALVPNWFGALEPPPDAPLLDDVDVFIVPGLGYDLAGNRLGQGAGFYDAALRARPEALRIAPCYDFQVLAAIPHGEQDEPVDVIVTPSGAHRTGARPLPAIEAQED